MTLSPWLIVVLSLFCAAGLVTLKRLHIHAWVALDGFILFSAVWVMVYGWIALYMPPIELSRVVVRYSFLISFTIMDTLIAQSLYQYWRTRDG